MVNKFMIFTPLFSVLVSVLSLSPEYCKWIAFWKFGQRTELYEYSKVLGNSQFIVPPFQPYKLIYAHMLAEVGKVSDSLKYVFWNSCSDMIVPLCLRSCNAYVLPQILSSYFEVLKNLSVTGSGCMENFSAFSWGADKNSPAGMSTVLGLFPPDYHSGTLGRHCLRFTGWILI